jgi:ubiquinone/menaquinone biosynthesis C-methylase UbiE
MRRVWNKTQAEIAQEWDRIAVHRSDQIRSGKDISYEHVLIPSILELIHACDRSSVLDVGCGCGFLTARVAESAGHVTGIDISSRSIELAKKNCQQSSNIGFIEGAIEDLRSEDFSPFSLAVANMSLMTMLRLDAALNSLFRLIRPGGHLAFAITHPCFWPQYWNYNKEWFRYGEENVIEAPFRISLDSSDCFTTTHIHRPLERYVDELVKTGFEICRLSEPTPRPEIEALYPHRWEYPRFLFGLCERVG